MKYKLTISYKGTRYQGWQTQTETRYTVQETIERSIQKVLCTRHFNFYGASRTDAGVHAFKQLALLETEKEGVSLNKLNNALPDDIRILSLEKASDDFNPQLNIQSKIYQYFFTDRDDLPAQYQEMIYSHYERLDMEYIQENSKKYLGVHDFSALAVKRSEEASGEREIFKSEIYTVNFPGVDFLVYCFEVEGSGFLKYMVRNMIGKLLAESCGRKNYTKAPACGLHLKEINYKE